MQRMLTLALHYIKECIETPLPRCGTLIPGLKVLILWMLVAMIRKGGGLNAKFGDYYGVSPQRDDVDCDMHNMLSLAQDVRVVKCN